jgi:hypothetical protein
MGPAVSDPRTKRVMDRLGNAERVRMQIEARLDECYRYAMPGRARFHETEGTTTGTSDDIYDETAVVALEDFASVVHSNLTPDHAEWASLSCSLEVPKEDRDEMNRDLEELCTFAFDFIHASNFSQEAQEAYLDLGCSTGSLITEWRDGGLVHASVPLTQVYFEAGADDSVGGMFRRRRNVRAELIPAMYPGAVIEGDLAKIIDKEADKPLEIIDAFWRSHGNGLEGERHVVVKGDAGGLQSTLILHQELRGRGSLPFTAFRFSKAAGEVYGRGPIMKVMSGIKTTNLAVELMLQNAAMSLVGMYQYDDDGVVNLNTLRIEPGAVIPRAPGSRGLERIETAGSEFNVAGLVLEDQRRNIRNGTYTDALGDPRSPMKAAEVHARTGEMAQRVSANVGRFSSELIRPYMYRVLYLLRQAGLIELPVKMERILVTPEGPLARAVRQQKLGSIGTLHQSLGAMYGPQLATAMFHRERTAEMLREATGTPRLALADEDELRENLEQLQQAMEAAQG